MIRGTVADVATAHSTVKVPTSETGIAITGMIAARQLCRNRNTTATTSRIATKIVVMTSSTDLPTKIVGS